MGRRPREVRSDIFIACTRLLNVLRFKYMPSIVLDGNFTAQHRKMKKPEDDVLIADGNGFMVREGPYHTHLKDALKRPDAV